MKLSSRTKPVNPVVVLLSTGLVLLTACNQVHNGGALRANAPGLEGTTAQARNAANPNGPLKAIQPAPHLVQRAALLDVNNLEPCQPTKLTMSETQAQSSGARHTLRLSLTNTGEACRLGGFPAISLLGPNGKVLADVQVQKVSHTKMAASVALPGRVLTPGQDAQSTTPSPQIMLPREGIAEFQIGWITGPSCEQVNRIAVAAPGTTRSILIGRPLTVCGGEIQLTAVGLPDTP